LVIGGRRGSITIDAVSERIVMRDAAGLPDAIRLLVIRRIAGPFPRQSRALSCLRAEEEP
jgi:hypothetical protein